MLVVGGNILTAPNQGAPYFGATTLASAELFVPERGAWSATGALGAARFGHTATALPDGRVVVAGGWEWVANGSPYQQPHAYASVELYDPARGNWSPGGALPANRINHSATLLDTGQVLVVGGYSLLGDPVQQSRLLRDAERFS